MKSIRFYLFQLKEHWHYKWRRKLKVLLRPICFLIGHKTWEDHDWGGGYLKCSRCRWYKVLWRPISNPKEDQTKTCASLGYHDPPKDWDKKFPFTCANCGSIIGGLGG